MAAPEMHDFRFAVEQMREVRRLQMLGKIPLGVIEDPQNGWWSEYYHDGTEKHYPIGVNRPQ